MADDDKKNGNGNGNGSKKSEPAAGEREDQHGAPAVAAQKAAPEGTSSDTLNVGGSSLVTEQVGRLGKPKPAFDPREHTASNMPPHDRQRLGLPMPSSNVMGDTGVHNAGNSGPLVEKPEYATRVHVAPLPGGLQGPIDLDAERKHGVAPEPQDPHLVAHSGFAHGMTAHQEAANSNARTRFGELRNFLRDFDPDLIVDSSLRDLVVHTQEVLHVHGWK